VDFQARKTDAETKRTPNAMQENGNSYSRIDLAGKINVTSHRTQAAEIEVTRYILGATDNASHNGKFEKMNLFEDGEHGATMDHPYWWGWYGWPHWWNYLNGMGRITWKVQLEPNQSVDLTYEWHYFWR
jgi:hypothetical protein